MWIWLILLYYVVLPIPKGEVETSFVKGTLQVGDYIRYIGHYDITHVQKTQGYLVITFEPEYYI